VFRGAFSHTIFPPFFSDKNGGGQILFGEFVKWAKSKKLDLEDDDD
jgi:hypothetical protein